MKKLIICLSLVVVAALTFFLIPSTKEVSANDIDNLNDPIIPLNQFSDIYSEYFFEDYGSTFYFVYYIEYYFEDFYFFYDVKLFFSESLDNEFYLEDIVYNFDYGSNEFSNYVSFYFDNFDISYKLSDISYLSFESSDFFGDEEVELYPTLYLTIGDNMYSLDENLLIDISYDLTDEFGRPFEFNVCIDLDDDFHSMLVDQVYLFGQFNDIFNYQFKYYQDYFSDKVFEQNVPELFENYDDFVDKSYFYKRDVIAAIENKLPSALDYYIDSNYDAGLDIGYDDGYSDGFNTGYDSGYQSTVKDFTSGDNINFTVDNIDYIAFDFAISYSPNTSATGVPCTGLIYDSSTGFGSDIFGQENDGKYVIDISYFFTKLEGYRIGHVKLDQLVSKFYPYGELLPDMNYRYFVGSSENGSYDANIRIKFKDTSNLNLNYSYSLSSGLYKDVSIDCKESADSSIIKTFNFTTDGNFNDVFDIVDYNSEGSLLNNLFVDTINIVFNQFSFVNNDFGNYTCLSSKVSNNSYSDIYGSAYDKGYNSGFDDGSEVADSELNSKYQDGYKDGYYIGYDKGYHSGYEVNDFSLQSLFWTIGGLPFESFKQIWNVDFLGVNLGNFCTGIMLAAIALFVVKKVFR